ncbi:hypothetical protein H2203_004483 [Taxawa tesnikishii (nom. ined.)]|nr:hypothetical protein H2203_004483 [Dothideales sp. JES 119]
MVDFSSISTHVPSSPSDPLSDSFYFKAHRRAERKEKQLRNIERERAFYEKGRLESLLDGLRGYDWMRVMGIHSSTEAESKKFERKRDYFIAEVEALLLKFKQWKDEERRLKLEKEAAALVEEEEDDEEETGAGSDGEPPSSEIDESAARQLQREMSHSSAKVKGKQTTTSVDKPGTAPQQPKPRLSGGIVLDPQYLYQPEPDTPFTSFYSKPHLRAAALGKARHGRNVTAFGQPIPEPEEREFQLPDEYVTPDALKASARNRRRLKRESAVDKKGR